MIPVLRAADANVSFFVEAKCINKRKPFTASAEFFFVYRTLIATSRAVTHGIHADGERDRRKPCCPSERHIAVEGSTLRRIVQSLISVPVLNANTVHVNNRFDRRSSRCCLRLNLHMKDPSKRVRLGIIIMSVTLL